MKRRDSIVCSIDGGERWIAGRWEDKETSLRQEWTGSTRFRKPWELLSGDTKPPAKGDLPRDVKGDILDFRPTSQQGKTWNLSDPKDLREI